MNHSQTYKTLVAGPAWVGDMVMAQSLFITLKQQNPEGTIDVIAPEWSLPLLNRMPEIDNGIALPLRHGEFGLLTRRKIGKSLRKKHYDRAIVTPRSFKSALVPFFARARQRTGYRGEMRYGLLNDIRLLDKTLLKQTVQRYVALGLQSDTPLPPETPFPRLTIDIASQTLLLDKLGINTDRKVIGLMPGAEYGPAKQWPVERFAELASRLGDAGFDYWVFGSDKERPLGEVICANNNGHTRNLCGKTSLVDAIDLIAYCSAVVTNDSGLMHVAAAVDTPLAAIYGSSTPEYTPPLTEKCEILYRHLDCSPCFQRHCPYNHTNCLLEISVDQAVNSVNTLIEKYPE